MQPMIDPRGELKERMKGPLPIPCPPLQSYATGPSWATIMFAIAINVILVVAFLTFKPHAEGRNIMCAKYKHCSGQQK